MSDLHGAVDLLRDLLSQIEDAKPDLPRSAAWDAVGSDPYAYDLSEEDALAYVLAAGECEYARKRLHLAIWGRLSECWPLPAAFSKAASYMLIDAKPKAKRGRPALNAGRDQKIALAVYFLWESQGISPTRGESKKPSDGMDDDQPGSGCAIVSWILEEQGREGLSEANIEKIWQKSDYHRRWKELR